jgi:RNA polymerase sigma-70 factor (ECF subfamily)
VDRIAGAVDRIAHAADRVVPARDRILTSGDRIAGGAEVIPAPSIGSPARWRDPRHADPIARGADPIARASDPILGRRDRRDRASDPARRAASAIFGKRNPLPCVVSFMAGRNVRRPGVEVADEGRASGVWEKADAGEGLPPHVLGALLERLYKEEEAALLLHAVRSGLPEHVAVEIRAEAFLVFAAWVREHDDIDDEPALLHRIVGHLVLNHRRALQRARRRDGGDDLDALPRSARDPEQVMLAVEAAREVEALLAELPEEAAQVVRLIELEGATAEEVAAARGETVGAVRVRLFRAKKRLAEMARRRREGR